MIQLIIGKKGSGKTKKLIDAVKVATDSSNGNVVCIEKGPALTYDIPHKTRLVNIENFGVVGWCSYDWSCVGWRIAAGVPQGL